MAPQLLHRKDDRIEEHAEEPFSVRYQRAIDNPRLRRNIGGFQVGWRANRERAISDIEFDQLRNQFKSTKSHVVNNLERFLDLFESMATLAGANVHRAANAADAIELVRQICERHGATQIAKSKSMVSEEIELNHALADHGIEVVETDAGEWIVQQAHERPSHIVGPALHMGRHEVGELLNRVVDREVSLEDIPDQVRAIRDAVRPVFFTAGVGMNGANALIAESGTVMIVTNEGNGRLSGSMPPVHIVLAGIEKLVPTFEDAVTQLRILGRSSTGQRLTVNTTFMTGPTPGHEMHIILLDNGRRMMKAMPEFAEALHCIRCGACSNVCPPYAEVSGHVFGHIYSGAIGLVVSGFHHGLDSIAKAQSLCLSCNACEMVCPVEIPLPRQILDVRKMVVETQELSPIKRMVLAVYSRPDAVNVTTGLGRFLDRPLARNQMIRNRRIPKINRQTRWRSLPALAPQPLRALTPSGSFEEALQPVVANGAIGKTVALFPGCMTDRLYPEQGIAVAESLKLLGVRVIYPKGLNCCGLPANNMGDADSAKRMARQTIEALESQLARLPADYIVSGSASCVAMLTQDYEHLFRDEPTWLLRSQQLAGKVMDFTSFLEKVAKIEAGALPSGIPIELTYHDSCQGMNALGLKQEPRRLLTEVLGCDLRELDDIPMCCGFGGSFSFDYPEIAQRLMDRKLDAAEQTGARLLVTDNQGCIMHLRGGVDAEGRTIEVKHIAEIVAARLAEVKST
ncbi:MAG: LUD domain-containing protein, partial [Thermomicrobiales bacterium]|nr:LUD domain-containing protein [Thermomicrobiales bacterium]